MTELLTRKEILRDVEKWKEQARKEAVEDRDIGVDGVDFHVGDHVRSEMGVIIVVMGVGPERLYIHTPEDERYPLKHGNKGYYKLAFRPEREPPRPPFNRWESL